MKKMILLLLSISLFASAQMTDDVLEIQKQWAIANYQTPEKQKEDVFEALAKAATQVVLNNSKNPHALIWEGIVYSTYAGETGAFAAGKLAKHAKKSYEQAIKIDDSVLTGSAYTSLGVLYYKVPGWPLSFGSDKKAMKQLKKGLEFNPDGIDSNYFFAEFLYDEEGEYALAKEHLLKAQNAAVRPTRPLADKGRHEDIVLLMKKIEKKL